MRDFDDLYQKPINVFIDSIKAKEKRTAERFSDPMPGNVARVLSATEGFDFNKLKGREEPVINRVANLPGDGSKKTTAQEPEKGDLYTNSYNEAIRLSTILYPDVEELNDEESDRYNELTARSKRLQPVEFGEMGSSGNPNNPYSIDTRGLLTGLSNVAEGITNKIREKRLSEIAPELMAYEEREEAAEEKNRFIKKQTAANIERAIKEQREKKLEETAALVKDAEPDEISSQDIHNYRIVTKNFIDDRTEELNAIDDELDKIMLEAVKYSETPAMAREKHVSKNHFSDKIKELEAQRKELLKTIDLRKSELDRVIRKKIGLDNGTAGNGEEGNESGGKGQEGEQLK